MGDSINYERAYAREKRAREMAEQLLDDKSRELYANVVELRATVETLKKTLTGSGSCADVSWTFADLTIPEQTLILFVILLILSVIQTLRSRKSI